jgi:hypothetical protein
MSQSPVLGVVQKYVKGFIVWEVNYDSEQAREPNMQARKQT